MWSDVTFSDKIMVAQFHSQNSFVHRPPKTKILWKIHGEKYPQHDIGIGVGLNFLRRQVPITLDLQTRDCKSTKFLRNNQGEDALIYEHKKNKYFSTWWRPSPHWQNCENLVEQRFLPIPDSLARATTRFKPNRKLLGMIEVTYCWQTLLQGKSSDGSDHRSLGSWYNRGFFAKSWCFHAASYCCMYRCQR